MNKELKDAFDANEASKLPTDTLVAELEARGWVMTAPAGYNEATGLIESNGKFYDPETGKEVDGQEAYKRASGGF